LASAAPAGSEPLRISSQSQDSLVMRGYDALQAGRFAEAKTAYTQALRADPRDVDALLGLASLARREGDNGLAGDYYERVLRNDPRNSAAHAGLIALQGGGDPVQAESRLKSLINLQQSDAGATSSLNFALGNLYSAQRRWPEAQQAYFTAHTADAGNPDTLYNLAISLEHLGQKPLARQFYEQALQAGQQRLAAFDRAVAEQRLNALAR
jgi:tetratricopeptide (TPR) repeat protein